MCIHFSATSQDTSSLLLVTYSIIFRHLKYQNTTIKSLPLSHQCYSFQFLRLKSSIFVSFFYQKKNYNLPKVICLKYTLPFFVWTAKFLRIVLKQWDATLNFIISGENAWTIVFLVCTSHMSVHWNDQNAKKDKNLHCHLLHTLLCTFQKFLLKCKIREEGISYENK